MTKQIGVLVLLCAVALSVCLTSCAREPEFQIASADTPLSNTYGSPEALARAVLDALADSSRSALEKLQVNEQEYFNSIWLNLDSRELTGFPAEKAWGMVQRDASKSIDRALYDWGGRQLKLKKVYVVHETREFERIRIIRGLGMDVEDESGNVQTISKFMNVVAEMNGRYKVVAFDS